MNDKPIFVQLMEMIEDNIISDVWSAGDLIISSTQICKLYNVNPATAMRALSELANNGILVKDRGIGMRLTEKAKRLVLEKRNNAFIDDSLTSLVSEAQKLGIDSEQLITLLKQKYRQEKDND